MVTGFYGTLTPGVSCAVLKTILFIFSERLSPCPVSSG